MDSRFTNTEGALSIRLNDRTLKHCRQCGHRLRGLDTLLQNHYRSFHGGQQHAWLAFEQKPENCGFTNFDAYLWNADVKLAKKPNSKIGGAGRRRTSS